MTALPVTPFQALSFFQNVTLRPFTESDWDAFSGCHTEEPLIGEFNDVTVVVDGDTVEFMDDELNVVDFVLFRAFTFSPPAYPPRQRLAELPRD